MVSLATVLSVWVRGAQAEGKAGHRGRTWMLSETHLRCHICAEQEFRGRSELWSHQQETIASPLAGELFWGIQRFLCFVQFESTHMKRTAQRTPKQLHLMTREAVFECWHEGSVNSQENTLWVCPPSLCSGAVSMYCGCAAHSPASLRSGWYLIFLKWP